jgi:ABC-2 type transport system ATP-binding protein
MIEIEHLTKRYGALVAVDDISFRVEPGHVLGFLGPNGAGKSTTMKMITGYVAPSQGTVRVCGHDVQIDPLAAKACMGYLPEGAPAYPEMTVRGFLEFVADVRQLDGHVRRSRLDDVISRLGLGSVLPQVIETLSKGFKRRVGLAQAILHDPRVLILDEPTDGLDPNQKYQVRALINDMSKDKIIVISTHILEEVEAVCNRAIIISGGRLLADDSPQALAARSRYHNAVTLRFADATALNAARQHVAELSDVEHVEIVEKEVRLTAFPKANRVVLPLISEIATRERWPVKEVHLESGRLDEVFRAITTQRQPSAPTAATEALTHA